MNVQTQMTNVWKQGDSIALSTWHAVTVSALIALGTTFCFYLVDNYSGNGEPFAWLDGISAWHSIAIYLFAALLSLHFIFKSHLCLSQNALDLTEEFGLKDLIDETASPLLMWTNPRSESDVRGYVPFGEGKTGFPKKINIVVLWERYLRLGRFWMRVYRAAPMAKSALLLRKS